MSKFHRHTEEIRKNFEKDNAARTKSGNISKTLEKYLRNYKQHNPPCSRDEFRDFAKEYYYTFANQFKFSFAREEKLLHEIADKVYYDNGICWKDEFVPNPNFYRVFISSLLAVSIREKLLELQETHKNDEYFSPTELKMEYSSSYYWRAVHDVIDTKEWRFKKQIDKKRKRYMKTEALPVIIAALDDYFKNDKNYQSAIKPAQTQNFCATEPITPVTEQPEGKKGGLPLDLLQPAHTQNVETTGQTTTGINLSEIFD